MNSIEIHSPRPSAHAIAPVAPISLQTAFALLASLLLALTFSLRAAAQEQQTDEGRRIVFTDTLAHHAPQPKVVFTNTPPARDEAEVAEPEAVHAEKASDDYDNSTPTAWWIYTGQSIDGVTALINRDDARLIDVEVDSFSPYSLTVTMVKNTGAYKKTWWWYVGYTQAQVSAKLTANNARLISVKPYDIGGGAIRYAVVMIANTGADQRTWWWYVGQSISSISSLITTNKARLITVDAYTSKGKTQYATIMVDNTGANSIAWWWYVNATPNTLSNDYTKNKARMTYLTPGASGKFNAIMESCANGCSEWWWYFGITGTQMVDTAVQNGARMVNTATYPGCGGSCFVGTMINNSNAVTTRVGNLIRNGGIGGTEGLYLEQVNGTSPAVLANLEDNVVFEPASTIKVLANLYAMNRVQANTIHLTTPIKHYTNGPESCPDPPVINGTEPLGMALREMMWHSDNARTREVTDKFTDAKINAYAQAIGMTDSGFHEIVGCVGTTADELTLDDAAVLYGGVANQDLLNAKNRGIFYSNMAGRAQFESEGYDWTSVWSTDIPNIINQVAPSGTTAQQKQDYYNAMNVAYKAGNYVICTNNSCTNVVEDIAIAGWFQLPVCSASATTYAEYVWGIMFSNEPYNGWTPQTVTQTDNNFTIAKSELLREQIQAGMASCKGKSLKVMTYSPADLVFASTAVGGTTAAKTVKITNNQTTAVTGLSVSIFGDFTQTSNCGTSLAAGASCTVSVKFKPSDLGERTGAVIVSDNGNGEPQTIELTGTGT